MRPDQRILSLSPEEVQHLLARNDLDLFEREFDPESCLLPIVSFENLDERAEDHRPVLVWGRHLIDPTLTIKTFVIVVISANATDRIRLALATERRVGAYSWEEKRRILEYCEVNAVDTAAISELVDRDADFVRLSRRFGALPDAMRTWVMQGICDLKTAELVAGMPASLYEELEGASRGMSYSNRRRFFSYADQIGRRDGWDVLASVIGRLKNSTSPGDRLDIIVKTRYPVVSTLERRVAAVSTVALAQSGVTLEPPRNFEGGRYTVTFEFSSDADLTRRLAAAGRLQEHMDELMAILYGDD